MIIINQLTTCCINDMQTKRQIYLF